MKAILVVSHGSRSPQTKAEVISLVGRLQGLFPAAIVKYAFLEIEEPSIPDGIENCIKEGAHEVVVALNFLNSGRHVNDDIPVCVSAVQQKYPHVKIAITRPVGQHPQIPDLFVDLINDVE